jgi:hypothetical protein
MVVCHDLLNRDVLARLLEWMRDMCEHESMKINEMNELDILIHQSYHYKIVE